MERMAQKSTVNLLENIEKSKNTSFAKFLYALGIRHVGIKTAEILAEKFPSIELLINAKDEDLNEIDEIGTKIAESLIYFFSLKQTHVVLDKFRKSGIQMQQTNPKEKISDNFFKGKNFVITGSLEHFKRNKLEDLIKQKGGSTSSSVGKKTNALIAGKDPGSKYEKAKNLNIDIIDEKKLIALLEISNKGLREQGQFEF